MIRLTSVVFLGLCLAACGGSSTGNGGSDGVGGAGGLGGAAGSSGAGGHGGTAGSSGAGGHGGAAGSGGSGDADLCAGIECAASECRSGGRCNPDDGTCTYATIAEDGTACSEGECLSGGCGQAGAWACTEQGIRDAIAAGGGPHYFACDEETAVFTKAEIVIDNDVVLEGEGDLTVDAQGAHRVFSVASGITAELRGLSITGGGGPHRGAGIRIRDATLALVDCIVSDNEAGSGERGGGINNSGDVTLTNCTVSGNEALDGGGIYSGGTLALTNVTLSDNTARNHGGGLMISGDTTRVTLVDCTVSGNHAANYGGGISNGFYGPFSNAALSLTNTTVSENTAGEPDGEMFTGDGGGIFASGTVALTNVTVLRNSATRRGGGINSWGTMTLANSTVSGNVGESGGGIFATEDVTLESSTVSNNTARFGGGIYNRRALTLTNATVSNNTAADVGGGIYTGTFGGPVTLTHCTVSGNAADAVSGIFVGTPTTLTNSLIDGDCGVDDEGPGITSGGYNLESPGDTCGFDQPTDRVDVNAGDLRLGTLGDYGGPTPTHALFSGSVAIDMVPEVACVDPDRQPLTTDQRGLARDLICDVGAFEVQQ